MRNFSTVDRFAFFLAGAVLLALGAAGCAGPGQTTQAPAETSEDWITLFDGQPEQLQQWTMAGPGRFRLQQDESIVSEGGMGLFYYSERRFRDYVLELDWKVASDSVNSGIFLRFPEQTDDPWDAVEHGYEIQIFDRGDPQNRTGAVYNASAPFRVTSRPAGQWNDMRIRVTGQRYQIWLNGEKVNDFVGDRGRQGYIGLQNHDDASETAFRNIRVKPLSEDQVETPETLAELFASDDLSADPIRVLMLTSTYGYRHESAIETAKPLMEALETTTEFEFDITEDLDDLNRENLQNYDLLFFNNTTGNLPVTGAQKQAILEFMRAGNGFVGAHAAADTWYNWAPYREMLGGGLFEHHPWTESVGITIEDTDNPAVSHFGDGFYLRDEIYVLDANPRWNSRVLASLDMQSVGIEQGPATADRNDYPIAWIGNFNGGRVFYTKLGHFADVWRTPMYLEHLLQGMRMAAGRIEADFSGHREKTTVADDVWPDDIAVDERGNVWIAELQGKVHRYDAAADETRQIGQVHTTDPTKIEHGLYGIEVDPNFYEGEPYVYLYYAEPETFINTLFRYEYRNGEIDMSTEEVILRVPTEPNCCHQAGDIEWGPEGKLYLSTGDTGMSETRPSWEISEEEIQSFMERYDLEDYHWSRLVDSERSAQNLQDLRGKILRINPDGTIPTDNPFYGEAGVRWEIYAYGFRNPYRFKVDDNGDIYTGVVGPDEVVTYDEYNLTTEGGENHGWPRTLGRLFYNEWTADMIPNFTPPLWEYTYEGGGRSATVGPIYESRAEYAFPAAFQDKVFVFDWSRRWIKWADVEDRTFQNDVEADVKRETYAAEMPARRFTNIKTFDVLDITAPISMEQAPDGSIYLAEFDGFWNAGPNSRVTRYRWISGNRAPVAELTADKRSGQPPLTVQFGGDSSYDPNADAVSYEWTFGDGATSTAANPTHTYESEGSYTARLVVTDENGLASDSSTVEITVGNTAPGVEIVAPGAGAMLESTEFPLTVEAQASDPEDGRLSGAALQWTVVAEYVEEGRLQREEITSFTGRTDRLDLRDALDERGDRIRYILTVTATDEGGLTGLAERVVRHLRMQAEIADEAAGFDIENDTVQVATRSGDYLVWRNVDLSTFNHGAVRMSPGSSGGVVEVRLDNVQGELLTTIELSGDDRNDRTWQHEEFPLSDVQGQRDLYLIVREQHGGDRPIAVDWLRLGSSGTSSGPSSE
jgi:glucose/arabinose dehydrogenase